VASSPFITGYSTQTIPAPGPIVDVLYNSSGFAGTVTYTIYPNLFGCVGLPKTIVINVPKKLCEFPGVLDIGSCIIDMGSNAVIPQTYANGLKPYGLLFQLVNIYQVPVYWAINPAKSYVNPLNKVDQTDFSVDGKNFRGGPFIVPAEWASLPYVDSVIDSWRAKGVVVHYNTVPFSPLFMNKLPICPMWFSMRHMVMK